MHRHEYFEPLAWISVVLICITGACIITNICITNDTERDKMYTEMGLVKFTMKVPATYENKVIWIRPIDINKYSTLNKEGDTYLKALEEANLEILRAKEDLNTNR